MAKILLVEDDINLREIFEMRLQADGYQTLTASDGEAALVVAMKERPDLIIADVMMPKMSGFEMLETLRAAPEIAQTKVIMMSALGQAEDQARGTQLGVVKYLVKSQVTLEDFARVVSEVLGSGSSRVAPATQGTAPPTEASSANNNKVESEKSMDDTTPTNPPIPTPPTNGVPGDNPVTTPAPTNMGGGQQSTADEQSTVNSQVNDFASAAPATGGDPTATPTANPAADGADGSPNNAPVTPPTDPAMPSGGSGETPA